MMEEQWLRESCIVVNNESTYRAINQLVEGKIILLNYPCNHDLIDIGKNRIVLCFGKDAVSIRADVELKPLPKYHFINAFKEMKVENAEEMYHFTRGSIKSIIRRMSGSTNEKRPKWADKEKKDLLSPLLFLRKINRQSTMDRALVEALSGEAFEEVEKVYQDLNRMEDSPIKLTEEYYVLVNYEETWDTLQYSINGSQYDRLTNTIISLLNEIIDKKQALGIHSKNIGRSTTLHNLFSNYIYFSLDDLASPILKQTVQGFLEYCYKPNTDSIIVSHLSTLAEASPDVVCKFLWNDLKKSDGIICKAFEEKDNTDNDIYILFCLDELTHHIESAVLACKMLFIIFCMDYNYMCSNSPENSLSTALCLINTSVALSLQQKVEMIRYFLKTDPRHGIQIALKVIDGNGFAIPVRYGKRNSKTDDQITILEYCNAIEAIEEMCYQYAIAMGSADVILSIINDYHRVRPEFFKKMATSFD